MELADVRCLAVLGLRRSGRPAALLARRELPAARVIALDEGAPPDDDTVAVLEAAGVEVLTGPAALLPEGADLLVKSPGVPDGSAAVQEAFRRGVVLWSEVEFACRFLPNPVVGITGTNGKTTTTERSPAPSFATPGCRWQWAATWGTLWRPCRARSRPTRPWSLSSPASSSSTSNASGRPWPCFST